MWRTTTGEHSALNSRPSNSHLGGRRSLKSEVTKGSLRLDTRDKLFKRYMIDSN